MAYHRIATITVAFHPDFGEPLWPSLPFASRPPVPAPKEPLPVSRADEAPVPCKPLTAPLIVPLDSGVAVLQQAPPPLTAPRKSFPSSSFPEIISRNKASTSPIPPNRFPLDRRF